MAIIKKSEDEKKVAGENFGEINLDESSEAAPEVLEKKEALGESEVGDQKELEQEIEKVNFTETNKPKPAAVKNDEIQPQLEKLLKLAEEKGVVYAVSMVKKLDDPYLLDMFHDALAKQGFYKKFKE